MTYEIHRLPRNHRELKTAKQKAFMATQRGLGLKANLEAAAFLPAAILRQARILADPAWEDEHWPALEGLTAASPLLEPLGEQPDAVLIGTQALALWAQLLGIKDGPLEPEDRCTYDFLGGASAALETYERLDPSGPAQLEILPPDEAAATHPSARIRLPRPNPDQGVTLRYWVLMPGLNERDVQRHAQPVRFGAVIHPLIHPVHALESAVYELITQRQPRTPDGVAQVRNAIRITAGFLAQLIDQGRIEETYPLCERIGAFAGRDPACRAFLRFGLDSLEAIPLDRYEGTGFATEHYPAIEAAVRAARNQLKDLQDRLERALRTGNRRVENP